MSHVGRRFAHEPLYDFQRGKVKVYCRCAAQSGLLDTFEEAHEAHRTHVGLKELEEKVRMH